MASVPARSFKDFATRRIILEKVVDRRLGHESASPPDSWSWDTRYIVEDRSTETLPFPGLRRSHLLGIPREYWQNGPISGRSGKDFRVEEIKELFSGGRTKWVPVIHNGALNIWRDQTYFFSDDSVIELLDASSVDSAGRSIHTLGRTLRTGSPIQATIYRRDRDNEFLPWRNYVRRSYLTGIVNSDGVEQTTRDGDTFYWSNVDTTKREFTSYVKEEQVSLLFNQSVVESVTSLSTPSSLSDFNDYEYLGTSDGTDSQKFESKIFPISQDSYLAIYIVDIERSFWTSYSVVDEFTAPNQVILDPYLGSFTFGAAGTINAPPAKERVIYLAYRAIPRIEYEEDGYSEVSYAKDADVNPLGQSMNRGFVTLARTELDIASITLETTKPIYPQMSSTFGPVYIGADYASLLATVYSSSGEVVPNAEVSFFFETDPSFGGLGGSSSLTERRTGFDGIARTFYVPPTNVEPIGYYITSVTGSTITLDSDANYTDAQDIYLYYVLKDDPLVGIPGADESIGEVPWNSTTLNGRKTVAFAWNDSAINPISGHLGAYAPIRPSSISGGNVLTYSDSLTAPDTSSYGTVHTAATITSSALDWTTDSSQSWTTNELRGCVIYSSSLDEYRRVASNDGDTVTLTSPWSNIPSGSLTIYNKVSNLGAYWVVSDRFITVRASVYSPKLGRTIYSNLLNLRVEIPEYMKGSYISSSLQEIPFGWRIVDDIYEQASAIDGATYISINPVAGPYPIVDVIGGDTWDPYSGPADPYVFWPYWGYPEDGVSAPFAHFSLYWEVV